ncbi:MAG: methionyl-tRNA formyltransferase [candidate division KSB1 bacterium]|nr:methionyl-tRNA formyltransferase [candidate division KSB1 bacterium]MDZ7295447.1 methionyl-tRNA formyltransferase [candidate division KSB1 bacterium]MDZ7379438.1 methionyl-tRNA formyltransferase [candidate division KSB1 bacterium]MDZ7385739.1 methionyl-tRNA formyltransferase [candidate division KSB1 bacterium]MDZ7392127.1 methionyl-tRNA formyltransferase [candidate division KSB1 bacterium]
MNALRIVFFGTPEFAVPSLEALVQSQHQVVAVVTTPDRERGRGLTLQPSQVKLCASRHQLPVLQPEDLVDPAFLAALRRCAADLFVVVAFRILPPEVFTMPPKGTVNLHASLLPKYRGAAPINWAIINGERETGVTTFLIEEKVDTGAILLQRALPIGPEETAGELHDRLALAGAELLVETVERIAEGSVKPVPQQGEATRAPKIVREMCEIDWRRPASQIHNLVRGLCPFPGAFTYQEGKILKVYRTQVVKPYGHGKRPGQVARVDRKSGLIHVATGEGVLALLEIQPEGKRRMSAEEFLQGHSLHPGIIFGERK